MADLLVHPSSFDATLGFATGTFDRLAMRRDDAAFLNDLERTPTARVLALAGEQVVLTATGSPWFSLTDAAGLGEPQQTVFLGTRPGGPFFAHGLDAALAEPLAGRPDLKLADLRSLAVQGLLPGEDLGALGQAKALLHWHRHHRFCANCGHPTEMKAGGWRRECATCGLHHFPRTDPVVIMMAVDGDRCLLGRQPRFPPNMYSCLAGFLEPGETIEQAVRRELAEEAGIVVGAVSYLGSQPWPFPASIMIGCIAEATSTAITIDRDELEDARWVPRDETIAMLEGRHPGGIMCPQPMAIAHHLMRAWAYGT